MCPEWSLIDLRVILAFETSDIAGGEQFGQVGYDPKPRRIINSVPT
jgi:hypothetical protein